MGNLLRSIVDTLIPSALATPLGYYDSPREFQPHVVAARVGYATVGFTLAAYAHTLPSRQADAAEAFVRAVLGGGTVVRKGSSMAGKMYLAEDGLLGEAVTLDEEADRFRRFNLVEVFGEVGDAERVGWGVYDRTGRRSVMMFDTKQAAKAALETAQRGDDGP